MKCVEKNSGAFIFHKTISAGIVLRPFFAVADALNALRGSEEEDEENEEDDDVDDTVD